MKVRVRLAALLHSYTAGRNVVEADVPAASPTLGEVMDALDGAHPGIAFRVIDEQGAVRRHMNVFCGEESLRSRGDRVRPGAELYVVGALSGG